MSAIPMTEPTTFFAPVSRGIFEHCEKIGVAVWVFLWAIDRTTKETPDGKGSVEGLVYGGRAIRAQEIGEELRMPARTVQSHLNHLVKEGYLRRIDQGPGGASGYAVRKSKKWKPKLAIVGGKETLALCAEQAEGAQKSADPSQNLAHPPQDSAHPPQKSALPPQNSAPYIRKEETENIHRPHRESESDDFVLTSEPVALEARHELQALVEAGWAYYLERRHKSPLQLALNPERIKMGLAGFESLISFAKGNGHSDPRMAATELFEVAVDRLLSSAHHNGKNDTGKKYLGWEQLFRSDKYPMPSKLLEYWLDDDGWPE